MTHVRFPDEHGKPAAMCGAALVSGSPGVNPVTAHAMARSGAVCLACLQILSEVIRFVEVRTGSADLPFHTPAIFRHVRSSCEAFRFADVVAPAPGFEQIATDCPVCWPRSGVETPAHAPASDGIVRHPRTGDVRPKGLYTPGYCPTCKVHGWVGLSVGGGCGMYQCAKRSPKG